MSQMMMVESSPTEASRASLGDQAKSTTSERTEATQQIRGQESRTKERERERRERARTGRVADESDKRLPALDVDVSRAKDPAPAALVEVPDEEDVVVAAAGEVASMTGPADTQDAAVVLGHGAQQPRVGSVGLDLGREDGEGGPDADLAVEACGGESGCVGVDGERVDGQLARGVVWTRMGVCR